MLQADASGETNRVPEDLANLDVLRALAVLLVVADHFLETIGHQIGVTFHPFDWYIGRLGVVLFFVHTSYVLNASLKRLNLEGPGLFASFYIRRAFRIYPLALVCVLALLIFRIPYFPWLEFEPPTVAVALANLALITNLLLIREMLAPLWTLPLEVQMYLVLPVIFVATREGNDLKRLAMIYVAGMFLAIIVPAYSSRLHGAAFAPCFLAGIAGFALRMRLRVLFPAVFWLPYLLLLVAVYVFIEEQTEGIHHTWLQALIALLTGLAIPVFRQVGTGLLARGANIVATYSYSIYLFHFVALWLSFYVLPLGSVWQRSMFALLVLAVLSFAAYHLIERPGIRLGAAVARGIRKSGAGQVSSGTGNAEFTLRRS